MVRLSIRVGLCLTAALSLVGCETFRLGRTPQPELKPGPQPEILATAPKERRFNQSSYPDMAFRNLDNYRRPNDILTNNSIQPAKASGMGMSPTGMPAGMR